MTLTARSCPTCHSIGAPGVVDRIPGTDEPVFCRDLWHIDLRPKCDVTDSPGLGALAAADPGEFVAVPRSEWAAIQRARAEAEQVIDGLAAAADRLVGAQGLADMRGQLAVELIAERDELRARVAEYERRIVWDTTCGSCAAQLDAAYGQTQRAEQAEVERDRLRVAIERVRAVADDIAGGPGRGSVLADRIRGARIRVALASVDDSPPFPNAGADE